MEVQPVGPLGICCTKKATNAGHGIREIMACVALQEANDEHTAKAYASLTDVGASSCSPMVPLDFDLVDSGGGTSR